MWNIQENNKYFFRQKSASNNEWHKKFHVVLNVSYQCFVLANEMITPKYSKDLTHSSTLPLK